MAMGSSLQKAVRHLRDATLRRDGAQLKDGDLLEMFVADRDEACFEALMRRHGPMVLGVCRRILVNSHDAEDAFQATFLVLARRAASVVPRDMVGNWLYGVACRSALVARRSATRRRIREVQMDKTPHASIEMKDSWEDVRSLIDQELQRLPEKYRSAVVLCDLEGRTRKDAARHLKLAEGTISGRLTTARRLLAKRLAKRGLVLSSATLAGLFAQGHASAAVPISLITSTLQLAAVAKGTTSAAGAAAALRVKWLAARVARGMSLAKVKAVSMLLVGVAILAGAGLTTSNLRDQPALRKDRVIQNSTPLVSFGSGLAKLQGTWVSVSCELDGIKNPDVGLSDTKLVIVGNQATYSTRKGPQAGTVRLDLSTTPNQLDIEFKDGPILKGIYEFEGERLRYCWIKGGGRPKNFDTATGEMLTFLFTFEKQL